MTHQNFSFYFLALPRLLFFKITAQNNSQGLPSQLSTTVVASHTPIPAGIGEKTDPVGPSLRVTSMTPIGKTQHLKKASSAPLRTTKASNFCPVACMPRETTQKLSDLA